MPQIKRWGHKGEKSDVKKKKGKHELLISADLFLLPLTLDK